MHKILFINTLPLVNFSDKENNKGAAGNQTLLNTLKGYSDHDFEVLVITFRDVQKEMKPFPNVTIKRSSYFWIYSLLTKIKRLFSKKKKKTNTISPVKLYYDRWLHEIWFRFGYKECVRISKQFKPDLIYGYEVYSTRLAKKVADKIKKPLITRFQGTELGFFLNDNDFLTYEDYIDSTRVNSNLAIMANDGTDGDKVLKKIGFNPNNMVFWVNGLHDKDAYLNKTKNPNFRASLGLPNDSIIISTANRFVPWKKINDVIHLVDLCTKINPHIYLLLIGDGSEMNALKAYANSLNNPNIIFIGKKSHDETIEYIANSDLYITLNVSGNLGNSILESLCLGVPVVTYDKDSVSAVLKKNTNSILIDEDLELGSKVICNFLANKEQYERISKASRIYAEDNLLSWKERMDLEINTVSKLIN